MADAQADATPTDFATYDLTGKVAPFLDRHMMFPMLDFLRELKIYKNEDITRAEIDLLSKTNMVDFVGDKYTELGEDVPEALEARKLEVMQTLTDAQAKVMGLLKILETESEVERIKGFDTIEKLCQGFNVDRSVIEGLVQYARLQFDCGDYALSSNLLKHYRNIMHVEAEAPMTSRQVGSVWGALASCILNMDWDDAANTIYKLDDFLDNAKMAKREVLLHRTWLLHWTLFIIFKAETVPEKLMQIFLSEKSMSIISLACPHLFRYIGAVLILQKRLKHLVKDTVWIMHHEVNVYTDPITRFLLALYTEMDFDEAQVELQRCETVCQGDYFLSKHWKDFQENSRLLIFETYCRIHQCINISMVASKLGMGAEEAELWIVKLIQNAKLDARIDSEKKRVVMSKAPPSVYQQVIERTKNLSFRSTMLLSNLEKGGTV